MFDVQHLPYTSRDRTQVFNQPGGILHWIKPKGITAIHMLCIGGGGGGGGGFTRAAAAAGGGGGGGGGGAQASVLLPAYLVPDRLYITVGGGGKGGAGSGVAGGAGGISYILVSQKAPLVAGNTMLYSGAAGAAGGGAGTGAAAGTAGAAGTISVLASNFLGNIIGQVGVIAGNIGTAGGAQTGAVGAAQTIVTTGIRCMGGTGGGGTTSADFAGGLVTAIANMDISDRRPQLGTAATKDGCAGFKDSEVFWHWGGLGGWGINTSAGGHGGSGINGSGGGGGGAGTVGGRGGNGGNGLVIITCW